MVEGLREGLRETIWAFCLMTSAGVRMAQETHSAREEERAWVSGVGRGERRDLAVS